MSDNNLTRIPVNRKLLTRLFSKIKVSTTYFHNSIPCWEWLGSLDKDGYGIFSITGYAGSRAHRLCYALFVNIPPPNLVSDHLCRVRHCVNPAHIEIATNRENQLRSPLTFINIYGNRTHCPKGHPFNKKNTRIKHNKRTKRDQRVCRICQRQEVLDAYYRHLEDRRRRAREYQQKKRLNASRG